MRAKLKTNQAVSIDEKSFFHTNVRFKSYWDYNLTINETSKKRQTLSRLIEFIWNVISFDRSIVSGVRQIE